MWRPVNGTYKIDQCFSICNYILSWHFLSFCFKIYNMSRCLYCWKHPSMFYNILGVTFTLLTSSNTVLIFNNQFQTFTLWPRASAHQIYKEACKKTIRFSKCRTDDYRLPVIPQVICLSVSPHTHTYV